MYYWSVSLTSQIEEVEEEELMPSTTDYNNHYTETRYEQPNNADDSQNYGPTNGHHQEEPHFVQDPNTDGDDFVTQEDSHYVTPVSQHMVEESAPPSNSNVHSRIQHHSSPQGMDEFIYFYFSY